MHFGQVNKIVGILISTMAMSRRDSTLLTVDEIYG